MLSWKIGPALAAGNTIVLKVTYLLTILQKKNLLNASYSLQNSLPLPPSVCAV